MKPDGYCAWHPEKKWLGGHSTFFVGKDFDDALDELKRAFYEEFDKANVAHDVRLNLGLDFVPWVQYKGWRIKPVSFIDPAELERLRKIEEWARDLRTDFACVIPAHKSDAIDALLSKEEHES